MKKSKTQVMLRITAGTAFLAFLMFYARLVDRLETQNSDLSAVNITFTTPQRTEIMTDAQEKKDGIAPTDSKKETQHQSNANIAVEFMPQAPFAVWDQLHEDACEEASFLMIKHFLDQSKIGTAQNFDKEINDMIDYETVHNYGPSITLQELSAVAAKKYNLNGTVKTASIEGIKTEIGAGTPVIVGAAGKVLPNPNFRNGGPNYHMLVIKGYDSAHFITNDPGTRKGADFIYTYDDLLNAIHNWDPGNILNGKKEYLVFDK